MSSLRTLNHRDVEPRNKIDKFFKISQRGSSLGAELRGGLATFLAMSYIIVLNPLVLSGQDAAGDTLGISAVAASTALIAAVITVLMGLWANHPFGLAAGLGVNALLAITIATTPDLTWPEAMGLVVLAGLVMVVLVLTGFREAVFRAVPDGIKTGIVVGIGLFITLIGLVNAGFVRRVPDEAGTTVPLGLGINGELAGWPVLVFVIGLALTAILVVRQGPGAVFIAFLCATI